MLRIRQTGRAVSDFFARGLWEVEHERLPWHRRWAVQFLQFFALVGTNSRRDAVLIRSASLAFATLLAIVPLAGVLLALSTGLHLESAVDGLLEHISAGNPEVKRVLHDLTRNVVETINQTSFAAVGAVSLLVILGSILSMLTAAETSFNTIFRAERQRPILVKMRDYTFMVVVTPLLLTVGLSLMATLSDATIGVWLQRLTIARRALEAVVAPYPALSESASFWLVSMQNLAAFGFTTLRVFPLLVIWLLFTLVYVTMPYTKVPVRAALGGAIVAGTAWQGTYAAYLAFQFGLARYNTIYGSLASLPFFLFWLYVNWVIVLVGAEIVQATETLEGHRALRRLVNPSPACREKMALRIMASIARRFATGGGPSPAGELASQLDAPRHLIGSLAATLTAARLLVVAEERGKEPSLMLARPAAAVSVFDIYDAVREEGDDLEVVTPENNLERFLADDAAEMRGRLGAISLAELLDGPPASAARPVNAPAGPG